MMSKKIEIVGLEIVGDLWGNDEKKINNLSKRKIKTLISLLIKSVGFLELGSYYHQFGNGGITGVVALAESHIAFHIWPEYRYVSLNVFICNYSKDNSNKARELFNKISTLFGPSSVTRKEITRKLQ